MIYLNNNTNPQEVWIPKQDGFGSVHTGSTHSYQEGYEDGIEHQKGLLASTAFTENGVYTREDGWNEVDVSVDIPTPVLEEKTVVISADSTTVTPSSGYDGMSAVTVDASEYAQSNYDSGFEDGFDDGYSSGSTDGFDSGYTDGFQSGYTSGQTDQKNLLSTTAITENGNYTRENGWSGVTVNVDTASTYNSGYTSGHTDGVSEEKAKLSATTFTANTAVTISDGGYSAITVNVPQTGHTDQELQDAYNSGYTSGNTDGENAIISTFSSMTATTNGVYGSSANPLSAITVNVPNLYRSLYVNVNGETKPVGYYTQSPTQWDIINENYTTRSTLEIMYVHYYNHKLHIYLLTNGKYGYWNENDNDPQPQSITTVNGSTTTQDELSTYTLVESGSGLVVTSSNGSNYEVLFCEQSQNLGIGSFSANGTYSASTDNLDGYSAITVNVPQTGGAINYIDYIETDGSQIIFDTGIKIGSDDTSFEVELDFMPLRAYSGDIYLSDEASRFNLLFRIWDSNFQTAFGNLANNANISVNNRYDVTFNYASNSGNVKCNNVDVITNQGIILNSHSYVHSIYLNYGIAGNCPSARYYKIKITKDGVDHIFNPCLDSNNVPCLYDEYNETYIYNTGSGTPIAGPTSEFLSGYTSGITLGETNRKCLVFEVLNYPDIHIYTTANKYYFGNGYKTIIDFYIDNNGSTTPGVTSFGVRDMDGEYGHNGFSIGPRLFYVDSNGLPNYTTYTQNPNPYGWQRGEVQLFYTGDTCYYSLYFNNEIFISSSFTRSTTVQNNYGIKIGLGAMNDIAAIESVKTYDSLGDLVGYIVYDPETGLLKDLLDYQVQFSVSGNTADISGAVYI